MNNSYKITLYMPLESKKTLDTIYAHCILSGKKITKSELISQAIQMLSDAYRSKTGS